jgi:hypothetical protein
MNVQGAAAMSTDPLIVTFPASSSAEGNRFASSLADVLRDVDPSIVIDRQRERLDTQDFGASLAVVLGTAAATAVAKGIGAWLARNSGTQIEIRRGVKPILSATHLDSRDVPKLVEALSTND